MENIIEELKERLKSDNNLTSDQKEALKSFIESDEAKNKALENMINQFLTNK